MSRELKSVQVNGFRSAAGSKDLDISNMRADYVMTDDKSGASDRASVKLDDLDPNMTIGDFWKTVIAAVTANETAESHAQRAALDAEISVLEEQLKAKKAERAGRV